MQKYEYTKLMEYFFEAMKERDFNRLKYLFDEFPEFDITSTDENGNTLLHLALNITDYNTYPFLQFLLSYNSDPMATNNSDINCIDMAKSFGQKGEIALSILKMHKNQRMHAMLEMINKSV